MAILSTLESPDEAIRMPSKWEKKNQTNQKTNKQTNKQTNKTKQKKQKQKQKQKQTNKQKKTQNVELVNLKCVTHAQLVALSLNHHNYIDPGEGHSHMEVTGMCGQDPQSRGLSVTD